MTERILRLGAAGLGRAFTFMLPTFIGDPRVRLFAAADPREEARQRFATEFRGPAYPSVEALCADPDVEVVYVATPHQHHAEHVCLAAAQGKHVLVEKPMAITLDECQAMIEAAHRAGIVLTVGHSHSFDAPIRRAREIIASGKVGAVRMITAINYTDFLYRPRRPEELVTAQGGGVVFSQAAHQIDIVRLLGGGEVKSVRAATGAWDKSRPTEGAYNAFLTFANGASASVVYSGYGHFDSDVFDGYIGEMGLVKTGDTYGAARRALKQAGSGAQEAALKAASNYGGKAYAGSGPKSFHPHFGLVIISCTKADLRPTPRGVTIFGDKKPSRDDLPVPNIPRVEVIDELYAAIVHGRPPLHDGAWSLATMEVCLAILRSAQEQREIALIHQVEPARLDGRRT